MTTTNNKFKLGVLGAGAFARSFIPLFQAHPLVSSVTLAEEIDDRRKEIAARFDIKETFKNLDQLVKSDCDAIAIFTQRWMHGPHATQALCAGKDVYSAVPAAITIDELDQMVKAVEETGQIYMLGETSRYHPSNIFCRQKSAAGEFGDIVYADAAYLHDMDHGFKKAYQHTGGEKWASTASFPPMLYPTHSIGNMFSAVNDYAKSVSCLGFKDTVDDGIFDKDISNWQNDFSNQTALLELTKGGMARSNEFRRVGFRSVPGKECVNLKVMGTKAVFEQTAAQDHWIHHSEKEENFHTQVEDVTDLLDTRPVSMRDTQPLEGGEQEDFFSSLSKVHDKERLPKSYATMRSGHSGSHQFLADDFCRAVNQRRHPYTDVWFAGHVCAAGIKAHESANKNGERLQIPDLGQRPKEAKEIDYAGYSG